jgi:hypothetical protein
LDHRPIFPHFFEVTVRVDLISLFYPNKFLETVVFIVNLIEFSGACIGELYESALCKYIELKLNYWISGMSYGNPYTLAVERDKPSQLYLLYIYIYTEWDKLFKT